MKSKHKIINFIDKVIENNTGQWDPSVVSDLALIRKWIIWRIEPDTAEKILEEEQESN